MSAPAPTRTSLWAIASLVCGLIPVPPPCLLAILLGAVGLAQVRRRPEYAGRRLAVAGITLGLLATAGWSVLVPWLHVNVRRPLIEGPREALVAGLAGDVETFRAAFLGEAPEEEAALFLDTVAQRYGHFRGMTQDPTPRADPLPRATLRRAIVPYRLDFAATTVPGEAEYVALAGSFGPVTLRWRRLTVRDADRGDLTYPGAAAPP